MSSYVFPILLLLPAIPLLICAYEDYKTRKVSGSALAVLGAAYIPLALFFFEYGYYAMPEAWILIAPQLIAWFVLLIYGMITGRGGADRVVILLGSCTHVIGFGSLILAGFASVIWQIIKKDNYKFPFIVPYAAAYIFYVAGLFMAA